MPRKHHKVHRHKDRHLSKAKTHHRKLKKESAPSQNPLEPIEEVSKEKVRYDKQACGDYLPSSDLRAKEENKHSRRKKGDKSETKKEVRHPSLEKNCLLKRTRFLFRKEKSFNDAIEKANDSKERSAVKKERKHKPSSEDPKSKRIKSHKRKHKSKHNSPELAHPNFNRVQEVIFCHTSQFPFKMKNDKSASEVKDLYRRIKREKQRVKENDEENRSMPEKTIHEQTKHDCLEFDRREKHHEEPMLHFDKYHIYRQKIRSKGSSEISLRPSESKCPYEHCKKHHRLEPLPKPTGKKSHPEGPIEKTDKRNEEDKGEIKGAEVKIHQIIESDLKHYFHKIQAMIDKKLDTLLQINKSMHRHRKKSNEPKESSKRSSSKPKDKDETKKKRKDKTLTKNEIVEEVLKRLKEETLRRLEQEENSKNPNKQPPQPPADKQHHHSRKSTERRHKSKQSPDKLILAKDSLECIRHRARPPPELLIPVENVQAHPLDLKRRHKSPQIHPYESSSSYKTRNTERGFSGAAISEKKNEIIARRRHHHMYSASEETIRAGYQEERRRSSSPGRYCHQPKTPLKEPFLEEIYLPPPNFRVYNEQNKHHFIVQGIEPPILQSPARTPKKLIPIRKLECKTVSIIGIQPKALPVMNQTQTSSKSRKSSVTDRDLVEKKKQSKRFKLYYKYSAVDNFQEQRDGSSGVRSIVSDSYRVVSDPSEEKLIVKECKKERKRDSESVPKKLIRVSTSRDSHLKNIVEEPSNMCTSPKDQDYFVPLRGTKEYYRRIWSSSHSDYCFKIDKKPANSNISLQSKDTWDGRYFFHEGRKCRYYRTNFRSRSDCKLVPKQEGTSVLKSRSDVLLDGGRGKHIIKSIFVRDHHPHVETRNSQQAPKPTCCKKCQTNDEMENDEFDKALKGIEQNQKQFAAIYKTIDTLEKNIHDSRHAPPKTRDTATSSVFGSERKAPCKGTEILKDVVIQTKDLSVKKVDAAIGTPARSRQKIKRTVSMLKHIHDIAVGESETELSVETKIPRSKLKQPQTKQRKSTAVSPIRISEEPKSPMRKQTKTKQFVTKSPGRKVTRNTPDSSPFRSFVPRIITESKIEPNNLPQDSSTPKPELCCPDTPQDSAKSIRPSRKVKKPEESSDTLQQENNITEESVKKNRPQNVTCFLHDSPKPSQTPVAGKSIPIAPNIRPVIVNTAACKVEKTESTTSSSVSSCLVPEVVRKSKSLVELHSNQIELNKSKSDICCIQQTLILRNDEEGSMVSNNMEKFTNKPNLGSHGTSLDQYLGNKFMSRLFLTKDYKGGAISAYQRRKLYDQAIRQKMKNKIRFSKMDVGPQIFEVRFLSMVKPEEPSQGTLNLNQNNDDSLKVKERNLIFEDIVEEAESLEQQTDNLKEDTQPEKLIDFVKKILDMKSTFNEEMFKNIKCGCDKFSKNCSACENFISLMTGLRSYRSSDELNLLYKEKPNVEEIFSASPDKLSCGSQSTEPSGHYFNDPVDWPSLETVDSPILLQPMSCPVLTTNTSSFDFLYEDAASEVAARDTIIVNTVKTPFFKENNSKSTSGSLESGYASVKSKSCCVNSLTNFFRKPSIVALFKPPPKKIDYMEQKNIVYNEMTKKCQLYARKVRERSELKLKENVDEYQEFSLKLLLGKNSSVVLESKTLSIRSAASDLGNLDNDIEEAVEENAFESNNLLASSQGDMIKSCCTNGCKLIINNRCLNIDSVVYLGPEMFQDDSSETCERESSLTLDFSLDSNNPFMPLSDPFTHKFLNSLIQMNAKEMEICNKLYKDESFEKELLVAVEKHKKRNKKGLLYKLFRKKPPASQAPIEKDAFENQLQADLQKTVATRLRTLASNAVKCFTMLAEAVKMNENIDKEIKICGLLRLLEKIENGHFHIMQNDKPLNLNDELKSRITNTFISIHDLCHKEAKKYKKRIASNQIKLIKSFVTRHRIGLLSESDVVLSYIGRGIIQREDQLEAAVIFLTRSRSREVSVKEFEEYCKFCK